MEWGHRGRLAICAAALAAGMLTFSLHADTGATAATSATRAATAQEQSAPQPAYTLPPGPLAQAISLSRIRNLLDIAGAVWGVVFLWLLLATRGCAGLEGWARRLVKHRWQQGVLFFAALLIATTLAGLPFDWLGQHYERAYGVSVQSWSGWLGDQAKSLGLGLLMGVPVLLLFNGAVQRWPRRYWLGVWLLTLPLLALSVFVEPLLVPLFYKQEPLALHHAALTAKLETVVAHTGIAIPPDRIFLIHASAKSRGINAFVAGIGTTKRFVLWDTATDQLPDDETLFIFGHESGHYVLRHIPKMLAGSAIGLFFLYWGCAVFAAWLAGRFGARWGADGLASRTGFVVLLFVVSLASLLTAPVSNAFSRHFEHQADVYGQEAIHGLVADPQRTAVAAFNHLGASWLEDPNPNPFLEFWLFNHPSVEHRAEFAAHYNPWTNGGHGEFFKK